jgi:proteasome accessory factor B
MPTAPSKLQRWLDVVSLLASRRFPVSKEDLWLNVPAYSAGVGGSTKEKQTVRRMFERDKDELRELGIPVETVSYSINYGSEQESGYRLGRKDFHLPYLRLLKEADGESDRADAGETPTPAPPGPVFEISEAEAGAALDGLRDLASIPGFPLARAARSAFRKLAFDLDPTVLGESPVIYAADPEAVATGVVLKDISSAVQRRKTLTFRYRSIGRDSEDNRTAHPYGLLFQHGRWYVLAQDPAREGVRMFRVSRMMDVSVNAKAPGTHDYEVPPDFSLEQYAGRKAWELGEDEQGGVEATVHFRFPRSLWADRNEHGTLVDEDENGAQRRRFTVHRRDPFLRWVLSLAGDARVEAPEDLREEFRALAGSVVDLHTGRGAEAEADG